MIDESSMDSNIDKLTDISDENNLQFNNIDSENLNSNIEEEEEEDEDEDEEDDDYIVDDFGNELLMECPICDSRGFCDHHLVQMDESYPELVDGSLSYNADKIDKIIKEGLFNIKINNSIDEYPKKSTVYSMFMDIKDDKIEKIEDVSIYNYDKVSLIKSILNSIDDTTYNIWEANTGPGYASSMIDFYAEKPEKAIKEFYQKLKEAFIPKKHKKRK